MESSPKPGTILKSVVSIMKDAVFQEIVTCVENNGIILAMLQGSKDEAILQRVIKILQTVRVLGLTNEACKVLISRNNDQQEESVESLQSKTDGGIVSKENSGEIALPEINTKTVFPTCVSIEESMKAALFEEIVQSISRRECSLVMATGVESEDTLQAAMDLLGNARIIYLAPDACEVLLENSVKSGPKKVVTDKQINKGRTDESTCQICNKKFSKRSGLLTHQKAFHKKHLPHKCAHCNRAFVYPKELRVHMMSHTGERPYHCPLCNKGFIARKDLQRHHPVHTGERAYCCTMCDAKFVHKANMSRHVRSKHEGLRPYICSLCVNKKYCDRGGLRKHLASVHQIYDVPKKRVQSSGVTQQLTALLVPADSSNTVTDEIILGEVEISSHSASQIVTEVPTVESASKILQQLSQTVTDFNQNQSNLSGSSSNSSGQHPEITVNSFITSGTNVTSNGNSSHIEGTQTITLGKQLTDTIIEIPYNDRFATSTGTLVKGHYGFSPL